MKQKNLIKFLGLFLILTPLSCNVFLQSNSITITGQVIDEVGGYPINDVLIKINDAKETVSTNKEGYFTIESYKNGDNTLTFYWQGKECSIMMIELGEYKNYDFGQIKIDVPVTKSMLLKQTTSQ